MLARGAIADINLFQKLLNSDKTIPIKEFAEQFILSFSQRVGEKRACTEFRKFAGYFYKGIRDSKIARNEINSTENVSDIIEILRKTL
jgi:tRNA-dihydrouridine synthase